MNPGRIAENVEPLTLTTADAYPIGATRFHARGPVRGHLVVAGAPGVPQAFYRRFADYASGQGLTTLTLDYRGIGKSKPATLKGFEASFLDWACRDLASGVDAMASEGLPLFFVGHSFGGHALGLLPNHRKVTACYTLAAGAGWHGWMPPLESLRVRLLWNLVLPILTRWKGYCPGSLVGMGEDLPRGVYQQWRYWCRFPHYFFDDPDMPHMKSLCGEVRMPIAAGCALDDLWALPPSRDAFIAGYGSASVTRVDLDPEQEGFGPIGHMGYFRSQAQPLWEKMLAWLMEEAYRAGFSGVTEKPSF